MADCDIFCCGFNVMLSVFSAVQTVSLWFRCTVDGLLTVVIVFKGHGGNAECLDYVINSSVSLHVK